MKIFGWFQPKALRQSLGLIVLLSAAGTVGAQPAKENAQAPQRVASAQASKSYRIGAGDILKILVVKQPLLSLDSVRVSEDGSIRLPMIEGEISALCLTEMELTAVITEKYKKYLVSPQVYVAVQEFRPKYVAVLGAVNSPGRFDVQRPARLLELISFVNGPAANAGESVQIFRTMDSSSCQLSEEAKPEREKEQLIVLPLAELMKGTDDANPLVQPGDIITVAETSAPGEAYLIGNVKFAKTISLKEPTTLSKAIAMAGGVTEGAKTDKIKITRQDPKTLDKTFIIINMKDIERDRQSDVLLQANDIVEVPGAKGTEKILRDIFKSIVPTIGRGIIPIY